MFDGHDAGFQDEGVRAGDPMALEDLLELLDLQLEGADGCFRAGHRQTHEDEDGQAKPLQADFGVEAADDAEFFQPVDALGDGGGGEADATAELRPGKARVLLQLFNNLPGDAIQFGWLVTRSVAACGHGATPSIRRTLALFSFESKTNSHFSLSNSIVNYCKRLRYCPSLQQNGASPWLRISLPASINPVSVTSLPPRPTA